MSEHHPLLRAPSEDGERCQPNILWRLAACIFPFVQIVMGAVYWFDCPRKRFIPVYLVVTGLLSILLVVNHRLFSNYKKTLTLLGLFFVGWFIAGNVIIYSIYQPSYNHTSTKYCDKSLYLFAFWTTNLTYMMLGLVGFYFAFSFLWFWLHKA